MGWATGTVSAFADLGVRVSVGVGTGAGCMCTRASLIASILILFGGAIFDFVFGLYLEDHICQGEDSGNK